jgi:peptide/nickel transport system substrate-binding protein
MVVSACASAAPAPGSVQAPGGAAERVTSAAPKKVIAVIRSAPASMSKQKTNPPGLVGSVPGLDALEELVHVGLTHNSSDGVLLPVLAEAAPTVDNGLWKVFPDGRMETTWKLRSDARWQDGTPVTTADLLFTTMVEQDKELGIPRNSAYDSIDHVEAVDAATITVTWNRPYIEADTMFGYPIGLPMPKHLLEKAFAEDKANFLGIPYWTDEFVGTGPFRIRGWAADSHVVVTANEHYVLGRPKIDEIEVRFIPDPNTLMANMLAGVEVTIGRTISLDQALQLRDQWHEGSFATRQLGWTPINVQFINSNPPVVTDLRFRRAMLHAIDRAQLKESIMAGQGDIAHSFVSSDTAEYRAVESSIMRYDYDPTRASQLMTELGYTKRSDGLLYDAAGQKLTVEIYTTIQNDIHPKTTAAVADYWKQLGVTVEQNIIPIQRAQDREYRAQFPAFELVQTNNSLAARDVRRFHSSSIPLPENRFQVTGNNSRYRNPELDAFIDRYVTTIPKTERMQALAGIVRHQTENLSIMGMFFFVSPTMIANRLAGIVPRGDGFTEAWNAHEWDVKR